MKSAERLNHDQFDLLCRAADVAGAVTLDELAEVLDGENLKTRAAVAARALILDGFLQRSGSDMYEVTPAGEAALK